MSVSNFFAMAMGVGAAAFVPHSSVALLRKPYTRRKDLGDICYPS